MTERESRRRLYELEDEYVRAPKEIQLKLDEIAEKYHVILNTFINSKEFTKEKYYELLDEFYNEYVKTLFSYKETQDND